MCFQIQAEMEWRAGFFSSERGEHTYMRSIFW